MALGVSAAQMIGIWLETLLLGANLVSFGFAVRAFLWTARGDLRGRSDINWFLFGMGISLCAVSVIDCCMGLKHNMDAFVYYDGPGGSDEHFHNISNWVNVAKVRKY
jgi:hypothetical protein